MDNNLDKINKIKQRIEKLNNNNLDLLLFILDTVFIYKEFSKEFILMELAKIYKEKNENLMSLIIHK